MAKIEKYFESQPRKLLTSTENDGTGLGKYPLDPEDYGNWTGGAPGKGNLVGTYRDISAVLLSDYYGRPVTVTELRSLTEKDVIYLWKIYFWDKLELDRLNDQQTANIVAHIYGHYGNIKVVQKALNKLGAKLQVDGRPGEETIKALRNKTNSNPIQTYNTIRSELETAYKNNSNPKYVQGFLRVLKYFPERNIFTDIKRILPIFVLAFLGTYIIYHFFYKK